MNSENHTSPRTVGDLSVVGGSAPSSDMVDDPAYQAFVESMVPHCHCAERHRPCDGVLAGGICDDNHEPLYADDDEGDEWHTPMSL